MQIGALESARGLAQSGTLSRDREVVEFREVLDCGGLPPLLLVSKWSIFAGKHTDIHQRRI
jgi:hypothetical protein